MLSTKVTIGNEHTLLMVDSHSLKLAFALSSVQGALVAYVSRQLILRGHEGATPSTLSFLSELECGINHAAEIARRLDVSRQMVSKTVIELSKIGLLELSTDPVRKNQKLITFTKRGELLMSDARQILAGLDEALGENVIVELIEKLGQVHAKLEALE